MLYRELEKDEVKILKDFLYEAIYIPEGMTPPDKSIVETPELKIYYEDFGSKEADFCIVAESKGNIVVSILSLKGTRKSVDEKADGKAEGKGI